MHGWLDEEIKRVGKERKKVERQLQKLGQVYLDDDLMEYDEYQRRKRKLEDRLASLVVPGVDSSKEAGKLLEALPSLWKKSSKSAAKSATKKSTTRAAI